MQLNTDRAVLSLDPEDGGRVTSLVVDGMELLVTEGAKPTRWGSFPMAPWAGRLGFARLYFNSRTYEFPVTSAPHANHGTAMHQAWEIVAQDAASATMRTDLATPWPFGGWIEQVFELTAHHFKVTMTIHAGDQAMPAQLGWHPWYPRDLGHGGEPLTIEFAADGMYEVDSEQLPTGELIAPPEGPWDDTFINVTQQPILRWGDALTLKLTSDMDHWVVFNRMEHAVAIEPQSGAPNDLNRSPDILQPGEAVSGWMQLTWGHET